MLATEFYIMPITEIGSMAKNLRSYAGSVVNHNSRDDLLIISVASDPFRMLPTVPELVKGPNFVFPIFSLVYLVQFEE